MTDSHVDIPLDFASLPHEALVNLWWTATLMKRTARRFFRDHDLTEGEFNLLMVLRHCERPLSQVELGERLLVDKSNVTGLIDRLEKNDFIRREPDPDDRRRYRIVLCDTGRERIDVIDPVYHDMVHRVMSTLDAKQCQQLIGLTRQMRAGLRDVESD